MSNLTPPPLGIAIVLGAISVFVAVGVVGGLIVMAAALIWDIIRS